MPELPEVETVRRGLQQTIVDKTVSSVDVRVRKLFPDDRSIINEALIGQTVVRVDRRAKLLLVVLSNGSPRAESNGSPRAESNGSPRAESRGWILAIHLKMTGQIVVVSREPGTVSRGKHTMVGFVGGHPEKVYEQSLPHSHTHVIIEFTDGSTLYFNDLRKFGWLRLFPDRPVHGSPFTVHEFLASLKHGPEPLGPDFTFEYFQKFLKQRKTVIKTLLLDQSFIAGIGNIYADEALFAAAIKPTRRANSLKRAEAERLYRATKDVLELGIAQGGTSFNSYRNVQGTSGKMRAHLKVYGREGQPCLRCGERILRQKIGQRSAHFCPACQQ